MKKILSFLFLLLFFTAVSCKEETVVVSLVKDGEESNEGVIPFRLEQNFPNPFNPTTSILYNLKEESFVTLKVYDVLGKEVEVLVNENKSAGQHEIFFNAKNIASGIYFYGLTAGKIHEMKKMIVVK